MTLTRASQRPDLVQVALGKADTAPEWVLFVGDTVWDVQACQRAGVPYIGPRSGGISTAELLDAGAVRCSPGRRICSSQPGDVSAMFSQRSQVANDATGVGEVHFSAVGGFAQRIDQLLLSHGRNCL